MGKTYTMSEARAQLAKLLDHAELGGDVVITRNGKPSVRLVSAQPSNPRAADLMRAVDALMVEFDDRRSQPLPPPAAGGPTADELVSALRADRDAT